MDLLTILGLLLSGLFISTAAMAIGIGGGILWTPLLILGFGLSPTEAVTVSFLIQVAGLGSGSVAYFRSGMVMPRLSLAIFAVAVPGVVLGSIYSFSLPQSTVQMALGIMALTLALLFVSTQESGDTGPVARNFEHVRLKGILVVPAFFGVMMGFLSTGIGEWLIPLLKSRVGMDMRRAIGTVVPVMFLLVLVASVPRVLMSDGIHWAIVLWGGIGTVAGGQFGPHLNKRIAEQLLKEAFIYLMTLVGIHLIFQAV